MRVMSVGATFHTPQLTRCRRHSPLCFRLDPVNHRSLNFITSIPPTLAASFQSSSAPSAKRSKNPFASGAPNDRLLFIRAPKRGGDDQRLAEANECKERCDDYEAGGLKPRAIKSVAQLMHAPGMKPTHLRLGSLTAGAAAQTRNTDLDLTRPSFLATPKPPTLAVGGAAALAASRFTRGIGLTSKGSNASAATMPVLTMPASIDSDDDGDEEDLSDSPSDVGAGSVPLPSSSAAASSSAVGGVGAASAVTREALVVANEGSACCICTSSDFVEPLMSQCGHICCSECWLTWLNENPEKQCPECDARIEEEGLRPIALCPICSNIPTQPWTAPCRHTCCHDCWTTWLDENPVCPECSAPIDATQIN